MNSETINALQSLWTMYKKKHKTASFLSFKDECAALVPNVFSETELNEFVEYNQIESEIDNLEKRLADLKGKRSNRKVPVSTSISDSCGRATVTTSRC